MDEAMSSDPRWGVFDNHVIPLDDLREHRVSLKCWCDPTPEADDPRVVVHHSMDQREQYEIGRKPS
jgi:hypothetical protein